MSLKVVRSRDNPGYRGLLELARERRARRARGETLLDGEHLLQAALDAGLQPAQLVFAEAYPEAARKAWLRRCPNAPALLLPEALFAALSPVDSPSGVLASLVIPRPAGGARADLLLIEAVQDPGNLGALLRVAAAAGFNAVHLSAGCAEAWSPRALRGGQGAHFVLRIAEEADLEAVARACGVPVYAGVLGAARALYDLDLRGAAGFAFGNEGAGLSPALRDLCQPFSIPMPGRVESLNVAAAAAVCLFEAVRQRPR